MVWKLEVSLFGVDTNEHPSTLHALHDPLELKLFTLQLDTSGGSPLAFQILLVTSS